MPVFKLVDYQTILKMRERDVEKHCEKKKLYRRTDEWTVATSWRIYPMLRTAGFQSFYNPLLALIIYVLIYFFPSENFQHLFCICWLGLWACLGWSLDISLHPFWLGHPSLLMPNFLPNISKCNLLTTCPSFFSINEGGKL